MSETTSSGVVFAVKECGRLRSYRIDRIAGVSPPMRGSFPASRSSSDRSKTISRREKGGLPQALVLAGVLGTAPLWPALGQRGLQRPESGRAGSGREKGQFTPGDIAIISPGSRQAQGTP